MKRRSFPDRLRGRRTQLDEIQIRPAVREYATTIRAAPSAALSPEPRGPGPGSVCRRRLPGPFASAVGRGQDAWTALRKLVVGGSRNAPAGRPQAPVAPATLAPPARRAPSVRARRRMGPDDCVTISLGWALATSSRPPQHQSRSNGEPCGDRGSQPSSVSPHAVGQHGSHPPSVAQPTQLAECTLRAVIMPARGRLYGVSATPFCMITKSRESTQPPAARPSSCRHRRSTRSRPPALRSSGGEHRRAAGADVTTNPP